MPAKTTQDNFYYLLEYSIAKGKPHTPARPLQEADDTEETQDPALGYEKKGGAALPAAPAPAADTTTPEEDETMPGADGEGAPATDGPNKDGDAANDVENGTPTNEKDVETILGDLIRVHSEKLDNLFAYMDANEQKLQQMQGQLGAVPAMQQGMNRMHDQIKELTPPSPLESGNAMIAAAGGVRVEDYWNNWLAQNKRDEHMDGNPYYPESAQDRSQQSDDLYMDANDVPDLNKDQIKRSFFGTNK